MKIGTFLGAVGVLGSILALGGGLAYWKYRQINAAAAMPAGQEPAESVELMTVASRQWTPTGRLVGSVFAVRSIVLSNEVGGIVREVAFESGAVVEAGQTLLQLDAATEEADLAASQAAEKVAAADLAVAKAEVRSVQSIVTLAISDLQRTTQAVEAKAAAASALDRARADLEQAQAKLAQMQAGVAKAEAAAEQAKAKSRQLQVLIEKKTLKAPFRARMGIRSVHPGQYLAENTKVVELQGIADTTYLDFAIPQDEAWRVKPGMVVPARSEALGSISLLVQAVDATVDRSTRNVRVRTIVDNSQEKLRPGTFVDVEVPMGEPATRLLVPAVAVRRSSYGDHVFVSVPGQKPGELRVKQRFVKVGAGVGADLVIEDGLKEGERIATAGAFKLRDGALIVPVGQTPKAAEPAPAEAKPVSDSK